MAELRVTIVSRVVVEDDYDEAALAEDIKKYGLPPEHQVMIESVLVEKI